MGGPELGDWLSFHGDEVWWWWWWYRDWEVVPRMFEQLPVQWTKLSDKVLGPNVGTVEWESL